MNNRVAAADWAYPPPYNQPIIEFVIGKSLKNPDTGKYEKVGEVTLNNGVPFICFPNRLKQLQVFKFGTVLKLSSYGASNQWIREDKFWTSLKNVLVLHVHGDWDIDFLIFIIKYCKSLKHISFTYWKCESIVTVLEALKTTTQSIDEVTIDLNGTTDLLENVLLKLANVLAKFGQSLKRLMVITPESLPADPAPRAYQILSKILIPHACVILAYGREDQHCSKKLKNVWKYSEAGWLFFARNDSTYQAETRDKVFVLYELYQKHMQQVVLKVGCQKGYHGNADNSDGQNMDGVNLECDDKFVPYYSGYENYHESARRVPPDELRKMESAEYEAPIFKEGTTTCCNNMIRYNPSELCNKFGIPGWEASKVQELVYFERNLEIYISNGLISRLPQKKNEAEFFELWCASKRLIIRCVSSNFDRRHIHTNRWVEFLEFNEHLEFAGYWFTDLFKFICVKFPPNLRAWTMTRISLERNSLRDIMNFVNKENLESLEELNLDGRDTAKDQSIASVINSLYKKEKGFENLKHVYLVANSWKDRHFNVRLSDCLERLHKVVAEKNAQIVFAVIDSTPASVLEKEKFALQKKYVLFPDMFSMRNNVDYCGFMEYYSSQKRGSSIDYIQPSTSKK